LKLKTKKIKKLLKCEPKTASFFLFKERTNLSFKIKIENK